MRLQKPFYPMVMLKGLLMQLICGFELVLKNTWDMWILNKSLEGTRFFVISL